MVTAKVSYRERRPLLAQSQPTPVRYLGWNKPILHSACDYLVERYTRGSKWDMDRCLIVLPGSLAGRRLTQLLALRADRDSLVLRPPEILTIGTLPERLYTAKLPFASDLEQVLAWTKVLRATDRQLLEPLLFEVPDSNELRPWMDLARILSSLHRELASDLVDFDDVAIELKGTPEELRWQILAKIQRGYLDELHRAGLWDIQSARRFAIDHNEVQTDREIILIGAVDLNRAQRRFLSSVADCVQALVGAPESYASGFNPDGTLAPEFWQDIEIPIDEQLLYVRSTANDVANELAIQLADLGSETSLEDVTVGIPDPHIVPALRETLARKGVELRYGPGESVTESPPMRLIDCISEFLVDGSIDVFNRLVRCPAIYHWLIASQHSVVLPGSTEAQSICFPEDFLNKLDQYQDASLVRTVNLPEWPAGENRNWMCGVVEALDKLVLPLRKTNANLSQWAEPLREVVRALFKGVHVDAETVAGNTTYRACSEINAALSKLAELPSNLDSLATLQEALTWLRGQLEKVSIPPPQSDQAIEMLGWLDLPLDDTRVLMLTGMHDGIVPESVNGDAFLPNQLRSLLGLMDNARRYARDAYAILTMLHTREHLRMILNHLSLDGDPQTPSRLLLAVPSDDLARRVKLLLNPTELSPEVAVADDWHPRTQQTNIPIPEPIVLEPIADMAATDFKKYDQCPYRYYLNRVKKVRPFEHERLELDGGGFGDLLHVCVEGLFGSQVQNETNPEILSEWLVTELRRIARERFGVNPSPALQIQLEQAERRLSVFAEHQARHAADGWVMQHIEYSVAKTNGVPLIVDGKTLTLHGRIDRIDFQEKTGRHSVWDYKTGDTSGHPREQHLKKNGTWTDWQLPLYGKLITKLGIEDLSKVSFGYILLPKNPSDTKFVVADFTLAEHSAAIESAKEIARRVMKNIFWPPNYKGFYANDDYGAITQRPVLRRWVRQDIGLDPTDPTDPTDRADHPQPQRELRIQQRIATIPRKLTLQESKAKGKPDPDWFTPQMILASAGTGKTYNLASRAVRLLFSDQELDSILATTFTRKAAGEILHRVLSWLADAIETESGRDTLASVLKPLEITRETVQYQLGRLCSHLHRFRVSTLDSFYSQLAKSFALELKLPPGWTLADPFQTDQVQREAISRLFDTMDRSALKSLISQLAKGEATRSVRKEIETVVSNGYELFRRTREEDWNRLVVPRGPSQTEVEAALAQFRSSTLKPSQYEGTRNKLVQQVEAGEWSDFLSETMVKNCDTDAPSYYRAELPLSTITSLQTLAKKAVSEELASRRSQNEAAYKLLANYHVQLQAVKQRRRIVTFDDIAERLAKWMHETSERNRSTEAPSQEQDLKLENIAYRLDCPIDHLLLDEFQDTSPTQWNIVKPFAEAIVQRTSRTSSFFCVGDSKQAIYGWRGGVSEIFESVGKQIDRVRQERLVKSFRSSPVVIEFVNHVFSELARHERYYNDDVVDGNPSDSETVQKWLDRHFTLHETSKIDLPGYVEFRNANCGPKRTVPNDKPDSNEQSSEELLEEVCDRIANLHQNAPHVEIGVLTRTNRDVGLIISLLRERGVEASQEGGNPLVDSSAVLLLTSAMKLANHPTDSLAYFHVKESPLLAKLPVDRILSATVLAEYLREHIDLFGFGKCISMLAEMIANECTQRDQDRLKQLIQLSYRFDSLRNANIQDFIDFIEREKVAMPGLSPIRVMTIHQSKGLEFDAVFMPTLDQNIVSRAPTFVAMYEDRAKEPIGVIRYMNRELQKVLDDSWRIAFLEHGNQQLAEALCVFYVGLTRAKQALYLYATPGKSPSKKWGSVLHSILAEQGQSAQPGILIRSYGDENWYKATEEIRVSKLAKEPGLEQNPPIQRRLQLTVKQETTRHLPWLKPSAVHEAKLVSLSSLWLNSNSAGAVIGKLVHRWFEEIQTWIEDYKPNKKRLKEIAGATLTQEEMSQVKLDEWLDRFLGYCQMPSILRSLSSRRYESWNKPRLLRLEVTNERRLLQILQGQMLRGVIDRCVLGFDGDRVVRAEILDFKTDQRPVGIELDLWQKNRAEHHGKQLVSYRRVLMKQYQLHENDVQLTLLLLNEDLELTI